MLIFTINFILSVIMGFSIAKYTKSYTGALIIWLTYITHIIYFSALAKWLI